MTFVVTLSELVGAGLVIFCLIMLTLRFLITHFTQMTCRHAKVTENQACHAICKDCGKDLGFIGKWREERKKNDNSNK